MNRPAITIRRLLPSELAWANARNTEIDFVHSDAADAIAVAEVDGVRAALGRIVPVSADVGELGGMYVLPDHRGMSLAGELIRFMIAQTPHSLLYCIPFAPLRSLYERYGFALAPREEEAPGPVLAKLRWCRAHYTEPVLLLSRRAGKEDTPP